MSESPMFAKLKVDGKVLVVHVIGYLGEPVKPGARIDATVALGSLVIESTTRANRRWNETLEAALQ